MGPTHETRKWIIWDPKTTSWCVTTFSRLRKKKFCQNIFDTKKMTVRPFLAVKIAKLMVNFFCVTNSIYIENLCSLLRGDILNISEHSLGMMSIYQVIKNHRPRTVFCKYEGILDSSLIFWNFQGIFGNVLHLSQN